MDIRKLQRTIVDGLEDVKAQNIVVFNTEHLSPLFERVIIASGTSNRQTKSLAASVRDAVKAAGLPPPRVEGEANGEWIIVDCGAAVVARDAAVVPRLLPPRGAVGRQAGQDEAADRRRRLAEGGRARSGGAGPAGSRAVDARRRIAGEEDGGARPRPARRPAPSIGTPRSCGSVRDATHHAPAPRRADAPSDQRATARSAPRRRRVPRRQRAHPRRNRVAHRRARRAAVPARRPVAAREPPA